MSKKGVRTIKRHIAKMPHIHYVGSGYSGHWEVVDKDGKMSTQDNEEITVESLINLAAKVMARTGSAYNSLGGPFDASKGELRKLNVTAGAGGRSYMNYLKVPQRLEDFCKELNARRKVIDSSDTCAIYELSFWAHYELVTIHPWADGNGRTSRLLMNLLQMEYDVLPTKVLKQDKTEYIQSLIDAREKEDISIFLDCMARLHIAHLRHDILNYEKSMRCEVDRKGGQKTSKVDRKSGQKKWTENPRRHFIAHHRESTNHLHADGGKTRHKP